MNLNELDLDINNYTIYDILNLYNLSYNYDISDLKEIKKKIIKVHPDKSNLDGKYFLFFKDTYKILLNVYNFRNSNIKNKRLDESIDSNETEINLKNYLMKKKGVDFNTEFNKLFEKIHLRDENDNKGYDDWLKSDKNYLKSDNDIEKIKKDSIINYNNEILSYNDDSFSNVYDYNNLNTFNNNTRNDLKKVYYDESIIPIDEKDVLNNKKMYNNVNELNMSRTKDLKNITFSTRNLDEKTENEEKKILNSAYNLYQNQNNYNKRFNNEISKYLLIKK